MTAIRWPRSTGRSTWAPTSSTQPTFMVTAGASGSSANSAAGKLRHYSVSVKSAEEAFKAINYPDVQSVQIIFNMFRHRPAELFFAEAKRRRVGILACVPLASGLLTGKMRRETQFESSDDRQFNRHGEAFDVGETFSGVDYERGLQAVEEH